jgi:hypothetical protein
MTQPLQQLLQQHLKKSQYPRTHFQNLEYAGQESRIIGKAKRKNLSVQAPPGNHHRKQQEHSELQQSQLSSQLSSSSFG